MKAAEWSSEYARTLAKDCQRTCAVRSTWVPPHSSMEAPGTFTTRTAASLYFSPNMAMAPACKVHVRLFAKSGDGMSIFISRKEPILLCWAMAMITCVVTTCRSAAGLG